MLDDFVFDYANFYDKLLGASRQGFQVLKDHHPNETFYCFAYYSHGSHSFLYPVAASEEGLTRVAQEYKDRHPDRYSQIPFEDVRTILRHSIADSPLNEPDLMLSIFAEVCQIAEARSTALFKVWSDLSDKIGNDAAWEITQPQDDQFLETCFSVLKQLDTEGMFGTGLAREQVVINFLMGDQSEQECLNYALATNPKHIVDRYMAERAAGFSISQTLFNNYLRSKLL